jgi:hypothetical protein
MLIVCRHCIGLQNTWAKYPMDMRPSTGMFPDEKKAWKKMTLAMIKCLWRVCSCQLGGMNKATDPNELTRTLA